MNNPWRYIDSKVIKIRVVQHFLLYDLCHVLFTYEITVLLTSTSYTSFEEEPLVYYQEAQEITYENPGITF